MLSLCDLKDRGWRFVRASVTVDVVLLADGTRLCADVAAAAYEYVSDSGVDVHPQDAADVTDESVIRGWGIIYGHHGFEVNAADAMAVFGPQTKGVSDEV